MSKSQFIHSPVGEHWACCQVFVIAGNTVANIPVRNVLVYMARSTLTWIMQLCGIINYKAYAQ